jgi:DNA-damage-inducible protein J
MSFDQTEDAIMAANQLVQTHIDGAIKEEAAAVLAAMGLTVSDAVRLMLTRVAREHALPFDLLVPNATTVAAMIEARAGNLPRSETIDELKSALNADDRMDRTIQTR